MAILDPPANEKQVAADIAAFEANPVVALLRFAEYFDDEGCPIKDVPPHILRFVAQRLKMFTDGRPPQPLAQAFAANKRNRNRAISERTRAKLHYHITFDRIVGGIPKGYARSLAGEYGVSESVVKAVIASVVREEKAESSRKVPSVSSLKSD